MTQWNNPSSQVEPATYGLLISFVHLIFLFYSPPLYQLSYRRMLSCWKISVKTHKKSLNIFRHLVFTQEPKWFGVKTSRKYVNSSWFEWTQSHVKRKNSEFHLTEFDGKALQIKLTARTNKCETFIWFTQLTLTFLVIFCFRNMCVSQ